MRTPNCKNFDFAYETYEGEKCVYCSACGGRIPRDLCGKSKCNGYEPKKESAE